MRICPSQRENLGLPMPDGERLLFMRIGYETDKLASPWIDSRSGFTPRFVRGTTFVSRHKAALTVRTNAPEFAPEMFTRQKVKPGSLLSIVFGILFFVSARLMAAEAWSPLDTQKGAEQPLPARRSMERFRVPPGFQVTLAAAEPDIRQPIAIAYDERGRLWVAESYSYNGSDFTEERRDRILIFEDTDGDGVFDARKVFHDRLNRLTGLNIGFGGVWITAPPSLAFIPDRDGDDRPDGEPEVLLDGWTLRADHNSVNGLTWAPDGWLYGRHGIKQPSLVGRPGSSKERRISVSCAIWRYHPIDHRFEVVADGTINPWGLDFDEYGEGFLSTSVVEHLWHLAPGARYERMKGQVSHPNPHSYELMNSTSEHLHWGGSSFDKAARVAAGNAGFGGGHAHSDAMIYLGDRWPAEYRGSVFMSNIHGRRINRDRIVRDRGTGRFLATHAPDFFIADDPWFRAVSLAYGPDGDVVMTDWSDSGECHDRDGVHRSSGRIYKISWGKPRRVVANLAVESNEQLVQLQLHPNDWYVRHARRRLQERAAAKADMGPTHAALRQIFESHADVTRKLRAMWALHVTGGAGGTWLVRQLGHENEHVRCWAVRLLMDGELDGTAIERLNARARNESSWLVRMSLASALRRMEMASRLALARALTAASPVDEDPNLARLIWYGVEPSVAAEPALAASLAGGTPVARIRTFVARRLAEEMRQQPAAGEALMNALAHAANPPVARELIEGALQGIQGQGRVALPANAAPALLRWRSADDPGVNEPALRLAGALGDATAIGLLRDRLNDTRRAVASRVAALEILADARPAWLVADLLALVQAHTLAKPAIRVLAGFRDVRIAPALLTAYARLGEADRPAVIDTLAGRVDTAHALLDAVADQRLRRGDISLMHARQIVQFGASELAAKLAAVWGSVRTSSGDAKAAIRRVRNLLTPDALNKANQAAGKTLFEQRCSACHRLFDQGASIGPDLTGSGRKDLEYLLTNIIDPNAVVAADYRLCVITTKDGRVLSGSIVTETEHAFTLRVMAEQITIERTSVKEVQRMPVSIMPAGLVEAMTPDEIRDLFGYLMGDGLPAAPPQ